MWVFTILIPNVLWFLVVGVLYAELLRRDRKMATLILEKSQLELRARLAEARAGYGGYVKII